MYQEKLYKEYPQIAEVFESVLTYDKHYSLTYDYTNPKRGISFERIMKIISESNYNILLKEKSWLDDGFNLELSFSQSKKRMEKEKKPLSVPITKIP